MISDEDLTLLSAYEDGELEGGALTSLRERLLQEPELRQELDAIRNTDDQLRNFASQIDSKPVPERVSALVRVPPGRSAAKLFAAAAAVFVVTIGTYLVMPKGSDIDYAVLDSMASGQRVEFTEDYLTVVASFKQLDGRYCRELMTSSKHEVACRISGSWQTMIEVSRQDIPDSAYQTAGAGVSAIDNYVREHISGTIIEVSEEERLIESDWQ